MRGESINYVITFKIVQEWRVNFVCKDIYELRRALKN